MKISALISCSSIVAVFCLAANATQESVLLDATRLSPKVQEEFSTCVILGLDKDRSREIAKIKAASSQPSKPSADDAAYDVIIDMAISLDLAHFECAKKMNIDPATLQHVIVK